MDKETKLGIESNQIAIKAVSSDVGKIAKNMAETTSIQLNSNIAFQRHLEFHKESLDKTDHWFFGIDINRNNWKKQIAMIASLVLINAFGMSFLAFSILFIFGMMFK